jgi:hypothetical protein
MRRLLLVLVVLGIGGLVFYRQRSIDRWEEALAIGRHRADGHGGGQPSTAPSS